MSPTDKVEPINLDNAISSNLENVSMTAQELRKDAEHFSSKQEITPEQRKDILLATACGLAADYQVDKALSTLQQYQTSSIKEQEVVDDYKNSRPRDTSFDRPVYSHEEENTLDVDISDRLEKIKTFYQRAMYAAVMTRKQGKVTPEQEKMLRLFYAIGYMVEKKIPEAEKTLKELSTMQESYTLNESKQLLRMRQLAFKK